MSKLATVLGSNGGLVVGGAVAVAAAVGAGLYVNGLSQTEQAPAPSQTEQVAAAPEPSPTPEVDAAPAVPATEPVPPKAEDVTISQDGIAVVSGKAAPGSAVTVLIDGTPLVEAKTDANGDFAALTELGPSDKAQILTLLQRLDGDELASLDEIIIPPTAQPDPKPDRVAQVDPEPEPEPEPTAQAVVEAEPAPAPEPKPEPVAIVTTEPAPTPEPEPEAVAQSLSEPAPTPAPASQAAEESTTAPADDAQPAPTTTASAADTAPDEGHPPAPVTEKAEDSGEQETVIAAVDTEAENDPAPTPKLLRSTSDGVEVLSNTAPDVLENIEIDTISYSPTGAVELAGRAQSDSETVRVYVDNRALTDIEVDASGRWRGALPQIATGVYTLRIDQLDETGDVTSRVETPFKREDPEVLAAADDPTSPAKQITVQTGNTLWGISRERYGDGRLYVQVFEANKSAIRNPDLIFPGQVFALPE